MPAVSEYFKTVGEWDDGVHRYRVMAPDHEEWLQGLAALYRELRTASKIALEDLDLSGLEGFKIDDLQLALVETQLPTRGGSGSPKQLAVERSDLGELALAVVGEVIHGYGYGYRSVRDRELVKAPGRGIDQIGVAEIEVSPGTRAVVLSLGEAKVSVEKKSPPGVVDTSSDCLRVQHIGHLSERDETAAKVFGAARATTDRTLSRQLHTAGMLWRLQSDKLTVRSTSMLVRDESGAESDFGSFRKKPDDYNPGHIDFTILVVDTNDIEALIDQFLALARREAA